MPLVRRIPKRGFHNRWGAIVAAVNVGELDDGFRGRRRGHARDASRQRNLAKGRYDVLKILGDGELTKKLKISAHRFSKSALEKIEQAGGEAIVLPTPAPVVKKKPEARSRRPEASRRRERR